jgi:hypothetical protein
MAATNPKETTKAQPKETFSNPPEDVLAAKEAELNVKIAKVTELEKKLDAMIATKEAEEAAKKGPDKTVGLDKSRPFAKHRSKHSGVTFEQDGKLYTATGTLVKKK